MVERNQSPPATTMQVDPAALRSFAQTLRTEATAVTDLGEGEGFAAAVTALPGTEFGPVAQRAGDAVHRCLGRIGTRLTTIADNLHNAAGKFELAEDDFAAKLRAIGVQQP
ncbi:ESX-1 secretion-associated protein [Nocardia amamiensis]|uniref:ESX-1 secretion-associated protein n=1 Tax=Nocardia amamiensis TaxID=404578 RepID=A0ABS0D178_9NOCA|nr:type VII secretion target [Nocardia amamiensis]MBF6302535.1 ESX-1 secretion-associated protein [Nocardia amamiensis]